MIQNLSNTESREGINSCALNLIIDSMYQKVTPFHLIR